MPVTAAPATACASALPAGELLRLIQAFYAIFWGLLAMAVMGTQLVVRVWWPVLVELVLVGGAGTVAVGTWRLGQVQLATVTEPPVRARWRRRAAALRAVGVLQLYFAVLFCLWSRAPRELYLVANAGAFVIVVITFLIVFDRAVAVLAAVFGHRELAWESRLFAISNIGFLLLPFGALVLYVLGMAAARGIEVQVVIHNLLSRANLLVVIVLLLPFSLSLSLAWAAKDAAARALLRRDPPTAGLS